MCHPYKVCVYRNYIFYAVYVRTMQYTRTMFLVEIFDFRIVTTFFIIFFAHLLCIT